MPPQQIIHYKAHFLKPKYELHSEHVSHETVSNREEREARWKQLDECRRAHLACVPSACWCHGCECCGKTPVHFVKKGSGSMPYYLQIKVFL